MNFPNDKFELVLADHSNLPELKAIYDSGEFEGNISVQYLRGTDPIASYEREGDKAVILLLRDKQKNLGIGLGACIIRRVYKGKKIVSMGYLTGLKLLPEYKRKVLFIPYIYQRLYKYTSNQVDFYFTTILKENAAVQRMLEKPRSFMPLYEYLGDYRVYFCKAGICKASISSLNILQKDNANDAVQYTARRCDNSEVEDFFDKQTIITDLSTESLSSYDLKNAVCYGLYEDNVLRACGYVLNQQQYKQYIVKHYGGIYKMISKLPTRLLGYPSFPDINEAANCACAGLWAENNNANFAHRLWKFMRQDAKEFDFLMIGLFENHPLRLYFEKTRHVHYDSRCYVVDFKHDNRDFQELSKGKLYIDVAFL